MMRALLAMTNRTWLKNRTSNFNYRSCLFKHYKKVAESFDKGFHKFWKPLMSGERDA